MARGTTSPYTCTPRVRGSRGTRSANEPGGRVDVTLPVTADESPPCGGSVNSSEFFLIVFQVRSVSGVPLVVHLLLKWTKSQF